MPIKRNRPKATSVPGIWKDGPNRYLVRVWWTDRKTGKKRKREGVAASYREAVMMKEKLRGVELEANLSRTRFADYAEQWIKEHAERFAPSTRERYVTALAHTVTAFGPYWIDAIEARDVRQWRDQQAKDYAPPTVNGWHRVLKQVLDQAVQDDILVSNPSRAVRSLTERRTQGPRAQDLTAEQLRNCMAAIAELALAEEIPADVGRMLVVLGWTGIRRGELIALRFDDVGDGELRIERSVFRTQEKSTKTDDPRRVTLPAPAAEAIWAQRKWLLEEEHPGLESGLVFPASYTQAKGGAVRRGADQLSWFRGGSVMDKPLAKVVKRANLPPISLHSFRRTYENLLRQAGVDQLVRRSLAGWRSDNAQRIYAGIDKRERDAAGDAMVQLVMGKAKRKASEINTHANTRGDFE